MATDSVEICNNALTLIGARPITSLSNTSKEGRTCNANYGITRLSVLRMHPWNFATKRTILDPVTAVITNAVSSGGLIKITIVGHGFLTGMTVTIASVGGTTEANGTWVITKVNADTFTLDGSTFTNAYTSGGTSTVPATFDYNYKFLLPTDFIRVHTITDSKSVLTDREYRIESGYILSNVANLWVVYVWNITDTTKFDPLFDEAIAALLAKKIVFKLTGSNSDDQRLDRILSVAMQKARFADSTDEPSPTFDDDVWIRSRYGANTDFVRDPMT